MKAQNDTLFKSSMILLCLMILGIVILGGLTRLTGAGLSIVEWKPITGILPPFSLKDWLFEFNKYQQTPEFQKINHSITLPEFQSIFWLEYIHRLWGRLLGIVLLIPTCLMIFQKQHRSCWPFLALLWILGAGQGLMGWVMVKSGLSHDPYVSPYRLAAHLLLGFAIFGVALWISLGLFTFSLKRKGYSQKAFAILKGISWGLLSLILLTAFWGALVAGLKAGLIYNTFPLMGDHLIPPEFLSQTPWWKDFLENPPSVQFAHRLLALTTTFTCLTLWLYKQNLIIPKNLSHSLTMIALGAVLQLSLGIATLLGEVPISLAILHQGFAFILFGFVIYTLFLLYHERG